MMSSQNREKRSRCGRGRRLIGSGCSTKPSENAAKAAGTTNPQPNNDDSSIVSLTSSTQSRQKDKDKSDAKPEASKEPLKDSNSMLSTDLYPTRDSEAEKVIRAELKNARIAREDQSTEESAMKPLIVSGSNFIAYGNSAPGRLKVRTKSRLKDDRAPRCSRERLPKGAIKQPRQKRHQLKSARGGTGGTDSNSPKGYTGKGFPGVSPRKSPLNPGELQTPGSIATQTSFHTESKNETEVKVETKGPAKVAAESTYVKDIPLKDAPAPNKVLNDAPIPPDLSVKCATVKNLAAKVAPVQQLEPKGPVTDISLTKDVPSTTPPARAGAAKDPGPKCASSEPGATKPDPKKP
ncbi:uncharacterized protein LOC111247647 [Varroa destructor]|uniref:Uncharacterized protein n=1 Tax=Varroa destructor TaxID=109461 RepID=A0A7M7M751_VARDE|nr:uncharacterized protein LOC111247647 [Varroa destructor]